MSWASVPITALAIPTSALRGIFADKTTVTGYSIATINAGMGTAPSISASRPRSSSAARKRLLGVFAARRMMDGAAAGDTPVSGQLG